MRLLLCASAALVGLLMGASVSEACDCLVYSNPTSAQRMAEVKGQLAFADLVFVGEVVSVDDVGSTLRVVTHWKGTPSTVVRMRHVEILADGTKVGNTCRLSFRKGRYLIFAKSVGQDVWEASMCSGTGSVDDQQSVLAILPKLCPAPAGCGARAPTGRNNSSLEMAGPVRDLTCVAPDGGRCKHVAAAGERQR